MKVFGAVLCLFLWGGFALADPVWVPPKGTFHLDTSITMASWDQYLEYGTSAIDLPGEIVQYEITSYVEYVPVENFSLDLTFPIVISERKFVYVQADSSGQIVGVGLGPGGEIRDINTNAGLGDVTLGAKYIFWEKGVSLGVRPYLKLPGTYESGDVINAPGDGQVDMGLGLLAGTYFMPIRTYLRGTLNLVERFGPPTNQLELMIEPGVNFTDAIGARFFYQHIEQFGGEQISSIYLATDYTALEEDSDRIGFGLSYRPNARFGVFGTVQLTLAGRNTPNTKAFTLGADFAF